MQAFLENAAFRLCVTVDAKVRMKPLFTGRNTALFAFYPIVIYSYYIVNHGESTQPKHSSAGGVRKPFRASG